MSVGDVFEPYGYGDTAGDDVESAAEHLREVIDSLGDIEARIEATEGVRRPILDKEGELPEIPDADYPDLSDSLVTVRAIIDAVKKQSADLDQLVDEVRGAAEPDED
ncbi:hypothetical protein [Mycobacteroides abscessus]|uniref:hypothetical protein n=1 Tax=Mycobacteroides abscessus TaxID=36809 RepID=UPI00092ABAE0|nr:hypothetical protein [Mycobacteroides abscessus]SHW96515.1 Uncharacterised protein [Mycobacteroides abscessus subsp. abscessus]SHZ44621.1 Uncharacterised protein [Mycobacteroides abscessus subsp. abscessus]SIB80245.1 Uncharacterised protein [Mycobacteroides abscessus subsp. abscessus]SIE55097.1 Uncharacterised protein [Mycobacteroides abscessus subsp. abscessus]SKI35811.1 Uncharacterised protein [Mycobacteroides abscessus subsp. abscessus]